MVGDSAYPLSSYLLVLYNKVQPGSMEDDFNFWLSNSRIRIECAFGELVMRFGMLWRNLKFRDLKKNNDVVRAMALLHNYLVDNREDQMDYYYFKNLTMKNVESNARGDDEGEFVFPLVSDNNEPAQRGRKSIHTLETSKDGEHIRNEICITLFSEGLHRRIHPTKMTYNHLGHVYCI